MIVKLNMNGIDLEILLNDDVYELYSKDTLIGTINAPQEGLDLLKEILKIISKWFYLQNVIKFRLIKKIAIIHKREMLWI